MIHLILVDHLSLFHSLDCHNLTCLNMPTDPDFTKCASTNNGKWIKIACRYFLSHFTVELCFFMQNILFDQFLFCTRQVQLLHLMLKDVPCLLSIAFVFFQFLILGLYVCLSTLSSVFHSFGDLSLVRCCPCSGSPSYSSSLLVLSSCATISVTGLGILTLSIFWLIRCLRTCCIYGTDCLRSIPTRILRLLRISRSLHGLSIGVARCYLLLLNSICLRRLHDL